ncbi:hypothetical protein [Zunongwangia atlantica]|uniref:Uncharacterized protein n=1 Tax=Zunongwangia atlantica 22II14-10F7 TaxID=1185767 RepID=A0A1Y1T0S0_9FLAO|nr:hypothetical protein [Zunongwangia atlantica]ORL44402.1 hypothetical protein IIF7_15505 [Zunongwangia atlantica 22II14-10F7]
MPNTSAVLFQFYRKFLVPSLLVNLLIFSIDSPLFVIVIDKLFIAFIIYLLYRFTTAKKELVFYYNLGFSRLQLFSLAILADIFLLSLCAAINFLI